jgi:hypothetical protein
MPQSTASSSFLHRDISEIPAYSCKWQNIMLLLHTLTELRSVQWKYDVTNHIVEKGKYEFLEKDFRPGKWCNVLNEFEPSWVADIDRASKICTHMGLMFQLQSEDSWQITSKGKVMITKLENLSRVGEFEVSKCYLWSHKFKEVVDPRFVPSERDAKRPKSFYDLIVDLVKDGEQPPVEAEPRTLQPLVA